MLAEVFLIVQYFSSIWSTWARRTFEPRTQECKISHFIIVPSGFLYMFYRG